MSCASSKTSLLSKSYVEQVAQVGEGGVFEETDVAVEVSDENWDGLAQLLQEVTSVAHPLRVLLLDDVALALVVFRVVIQIVAQVLVDL